MSLLDAEFEATDEAFSAHCDDTIEIYNALKCLEAKEKSKSFCSVSITSTGITFIIESHKNFQGNVTLTRNLFSEWDLRVESLNFRIGLLELLDAIDCLHSKNAVVTFSIKDEKKEAKDRKLAVTVVDRNVTARVMLPIYVVANLMAFEFNDETDKARLVIDSKTIKNVLQELDPKENAEVLVRFEKDECQIITNSETLKSIALFPRHSTEVKELVCELGKDNKPLEYKYKSSFFKRLRHAAYNATDVTIILNTDGVLWAKFFLVKISKTNGFVAFYLNPLSDVPDPF